MKIAITSSSDDNLYAAQLIKKLIELGKKPELVIRRKKKVENKLKSTLRKLIKLDNNPIDFDMLLSKICKDNNIDLVIIESINSTESISAVEKHKIDVLINCGGGIFKDKIINTPKFGILNAHMGYLPSFRGINVLEWSLLYNHKIGVTLHFINSGIDMGDILLFKEIPIFPEDNIKALRERSVDVNIELILQFFSSYDKIKPLKQNKEDGKQYFIMHPRLKAIAGKRINSYLKTL